MNTLDQISRTVENQKHTVISALVPLELALLNFKPASDSWSILECLEHLNRYSRYYNPALAKAITANSGNNSQQSISYSWLGKKSLDMVRPDNSKKSKTVRHMNPNNSQLSRQTLEEFLDHQTELLQLLNKAKNTNLNKKAIPVEFFKLLKLRIGEALEFMALHQERHLQQALQVKKQLPVNQAAA
ncbi:MULTISPECIES: DinB family protein [Pontibacter]|uniref:DinB superfamily protein n=1 Tax=Pontibacter lucknowensis TaxID=1077936 RepID=A0A1N6V3X5_9BACT|nr:MULTISPECIES: DinB family protein [Pontibacter]SIQ72498.1 DinB superfamily protein [Pontibacter lucknowensis]